MMNSESKAKSLALYDTDYQCWLDQIVIQLRTKDFGNLDLENLIEEIESLGKRDKRAIASDFMRLCEHLLKIKYWQSEREAGLRGWNLEVANFRLQIRAILKDSPSLRHYLNKNFLSEYDNARKLFLKASDLNATLIPERPDFTLEQALDEAWLPWQLEPSK